MRESKTASIVRACRQFAATAGGSATVEYAAILTMVVGLSYVAYAMVGEHVQETLSQVAQRTQGPNEDFAKDGRGRSASDTADVGSKSLPADVQPGSSPNWWQVTALAVTLLAAVALIFDRRRRGNGLVDLQEFGLPRALQANFVDKRQQILRMLTGHARRRPGEGVTVRHLMTTRLTTVGPSATIDEICRLMQEARIHHLLVVRGDRELQGLISDRDVAHRSGRAAADIMTANPMTVTPETPAIQAISMMLGGRFSCVPVVESGKLVGLLTSTDVMMALQCTLQILSQSLQTFMADAPIEVKGARYFARLTEDAEEEQGERLAETVSG